MTPMTQLTVVEAFILSMNETLTILPPPFLEDIWYHSLVSTLTVMLVLDFDMFKPCLIAIIKFHTVFTTIMVC